MEPLEDGAPSVSSPAEVPVVDAGSSPAELQLVAGLVRRAKADGVAMTGPDGLLKTLAKTVIETALQEEMADHLGYGKHAVEGRNLGNSRNGTRSKTVVTDNCGEVEIAVPRQQPRITNDERHLHRSSDSPHAAPQGRSSVWDRMKGESHDATQQCSRTHGPCRVASSGVTTESSCVLAECW
ncbi:protein of unknown function [Micropruina glycogenica]|uniref:Mutator family transposase n=1 Tax=Micropruina glycogenica TaxID=75385 RepID=A0A2N9JI95_9ACTN|nr:protein of unknown function [Micropruina glycogenica]